MAARKQYADSVYYERKLDRVIERLGAEDYNYNFDRHGASIEFRYKGQLYRFDHTVEKAQSYGQAIAFGSDAFAQIVLALEDLTRIIERGIYDLSTWVSGMKYLAEPTKLPECFRVLGFVEMPATKADVDARYRTLSKQYHPDAGGKSEDFDAIKRAAEQAKHHMEVTG